MDAETPQTRRSVLDLILKGGFGALAAAVVYPVARYLVPPAGREPGSRSVVLDPSDAAQVHPETRVFAFGNEPGILVRGPAGEWRAYSAVCTHLGCTVRYRAADRRIWCPCHNGLYDLDGRNVPGTPPPRPLAEMRVQARPDGTLLVRR